MWSITPDKLIISFEYLYVPNVCTKIPEILKNNYYNNAFYKSVERKGGTLYVYRFIYFLVFKRIGIKLKLFI